MFTRSSTRRLPARAINPTAGLRCTIASAAINLVIKNTSGGRRCDCHNGHAPWAPIVEQRSAYVYAPPCRANAGTATAARIAVCMHSHRALHKWACAYVAHDQSARGRPCFAGHMRPTIATRWPLVGNEPYTQRYLLTASHRTSLRL